MLSISQITKDESIFEASINTLISLCAFDVRSRENFRDIDTVLLKDALEYRELVYDSQFFLNLYKSITEQFEKAFKDFKVENLAFQNDKELLFDFLSSLWKEFFACEIKSILLNNSDFSVYVLKAVTRPEFRLELMNKITFILNERYS